MEPRGGKQCLLEETHRVIFQNPAHSPPARFCSFTDAVLRSCMATDAIVTPVLRDPVYRPVNRTLERVFYSGMAVVMCLCVFIGFSPTYFMSGMLRAPLPSPILSVHGPALTL